MAKKIIEARVQQKVDTEANWLSTDLIILAGEQAFVSDKYNFKIGDGTKRFSELEYYYKGDVVGTVTPSTTGSVSDGVYYAQTAGTYDGVVVREGYYTLLRKENGVWSIASGVKMPTLSVEGRVEEGNTEAVSGGEVYNNIKNLAEKSELQYRGTFNSLELAIAAVPLASRKLGDTVGIKIGEKIVEYWWTSFTSDQGLIQKSLLHTAAFNIAGYIGKSGQSFVNETFIRTDYIFYQGGDIIVSGQGSGTVSLLFYYDKYFQPISGHPKSDPPIKVDNLLVKASEIPPNTFFVIASASVSNNNAKLLVSKKGIKYPSLNDYKNEILMLAELERTTSTPTFNAEGLPLNVTHRDGSNRVVRVDDFTFSSTQIVETRTLEGTIKTFTTDLSTLKTTIS
ncbi:MAG: hypothetical protein KBT36_15255 [Kurthia sp.]|nr:hypothetical protein [Candidatus Kurthia equi]